MDEKVAYTEPELVNYYEAHKEEYVEEETARATCVSLLDENKAEEAYAMLQEGDDIAEVVALWTGVPLTKLIEGEAEKLLHLEERLHARVIGQASAVRAVSTSIRRARAGLQDPHAFPQQSTVSCSCRHAQPNRETAKQRK